MSPAGKSPDGSLNPLLEEGLALAGELALLEEEIQRCLLSMDFQGLAAAVEAGMGSLRRGERFMEQKKKLAGEMSLRELIALQAEGAERTSQLNSYRLLTEKLTAVKAGEEVNRHLVEAGTQIVSRLHNIISACKTTYNFRGELRGNTPGAPGNPSGFRGLDKNC